MGCKVDVLDPDKYESLLQVDICIIVGLDRHAQIAHVILLYLCDILRKKSGIKLGT